MRKRAEWSDREWMEYDRKTLFFTLKKSLMRRIATMILMRHKTPMGFTLDTI